MSIDDAEASNMRLAVVSPRTMRKVDVPSTLAALKWLGSSCFRLLPKHVEISYICMRITYLLHSVIEIPMTRMPQRSTLSPRLAGARLSRSFRKRSILALHHATFINYNF